MLNGHRQPRRGAFLCTGAMADPTWREAFDAGLRPRQMALLGLLPERRRKARLLQGQDGLQDEAGRSAAVARHAAGTTGRQAEQTGRKDTRNRCRRFSFLSSVMLRRCQTGTGAGQPQHLGRGDHSMTIAHSETVAGWHGQDHGSCGSY